MMRPPRLRAEAVSSSVWMLPLECVRQLQRCVASARNTDKRTAQVEAMCSMGVLLESRAQQLFREQEYESIKPEIDVRGAPTQFRCTTRDAHDTSNRPPLAQRTKQSANCAAHIARGIMHISHMA